jgi:hypothetical protein
MLDPVRPCLVAGVAFMLTGVVRFVLDVLLLDASTPMRPCAGTGRHYGDDRLEGV